jgi:hypothetical protein
MAKVPAPAISLAETVAVSDVLPPDVVGRGLPLTRTTEVGRKFWPLAVSVKSEPPAAAVVGVTELSTGAAGGGVTGSGVVFERQPDATHGEGAVNKMLTEPTAAMSAACTLTSTWVPLITVAVRGVPPTVAVVPATKPVPFTCNVNAEPPATTLAGESEVMAGVGLMFAAVKVLLVAARVKPLLRKRRTSYEPSPVGIVVFHVLVPPAPGRLATYT